MAVRRGTTTQARPAPRQPVVRTRTIREWEATTERRRSRRLAAAGALAVGVLATVVAAAALLGLIGGRGTRTSYDAAGAAGVGMAVANAAAPALATTRPTDAAAQPPDATSRPAVTGSGGDSVPAAGVPAEAPAGGPLEPGHVLLGSSTIAFDVGPENGDGVNVDLPLRYLDGTVIAPGETFDFWKAVGDVSRRSGYRLGAIIVGDHVEPQGALAGGICIASSAVFEAAARSGLEIVTRHSHGGYLAKYPLGLDAAVTKSGGARQGLIFRNDTDQPVVIRTVSTPGSARVDVYAADPTGRTVEIGDPAVGHRHPAHDRIVRTPSLGRGETRRIEPKSDGMTVTVIRTVRDTAGQVIHHDKWVSTYKPLSGLLQVGTG